MSRMQQTQSRNVSSSSKSPCDSRQPAHDDALVSRESSASQRESFVDSRNQPCRAARSREREEPKTGPFSDETFSACPAVSLESPSLQSSHPQWLGRYRIEWLLGEGGFARVYRACDEHLKRPVAIKIPRSGLHNRPRLLAIYLDEAQTLAHLDHPNIAPIYDVGKTEEYPLYIVSKFIDAPTLAERLNEARPSFAATAEIMAQLADALHYTHGRGCVHRDIKPSNILVDDDNRPYLVDFGLALRGQDAVRHDRPGGTLKYMSPEQTRGKGTPLDHRTDIFSLGVVLYQMLTGQVPFASHDKKRLRSKIRYECPRSPRHIDGTVPWELERICLKAIAKNPAERFQSAHDLAGDLNRLLSRIPTAPCPTPRGTSAFRREWAPDQLSPLSIFNHLEQRLCFQLR